MEMKDIERIARLEAHFKSLNEGLSRIEKKIDNYTNNFIPRHEAEIRFKSIERDVEEMKTNKKASNALVVSWLVLATSIIFNIINYMSNK